MIHLIHGNNLYESNMALQKLLKGSFKVIDGSKLKDIDEIIDSSDTISLFNSQSITVIKRIYDNPKRITLLKKLLTWLKSLKQLPDLIFFEDHLIDTDRYGRANKKPGAFQAFIMEKGKVQVFNPKSELQLRNWINQKLNSEGLEIAKRLIDLILIRIGNDQMLLASELDKLSLYTKSNNRKEVLEPDLQILTLIEPDHVIWDLTNAIAARNKIKALELNEIMMQEQADALMIISATIKQLTQMLMVKLFPYKREDLKKTLGIQEFMISRLSNAAAAFPETHLRMLINKFIQLDGSVKQGLIDVKLGFTLLIISL
jgi:DNA polymerase III delta subunit